MPYCHFRLRRAPLLLLTLSMLPFAASAQTVSGLSATPTTVAGPRTITARVAISTPAPAGGLMVAMTTTGNIYVAPAVTIAEGQKTATFQVLTGTVAASSTAVVTASVNGTSKSITINLQGDAVTNLTVPTGILGGHNGTGSVTIQFDAPKGGVPVNLVSNSTSVSVPTTVTIPEGKSFATFNLTGGAPSKATTATITASTDDSSMAQSVIIAPNIVQSVQIGPNNVVGGVPIGVTINLANPAPSGGQAVALTSTVPGLTIPSQVKVLAGATSVTFSVKTVPTSSGSYGRITATINGLSAFGLVAIVPPQSSVAVNPAALVAGTSADGNLALNGVSPAGGTTVQLSSSSSLVTMPASVIIPAGKQTGTFTLNAASTAKGAVQITAMTGGIGYGIKIDVIAPVGLQGSPFPKGRADRANTGRSTASGATGVYSSWSKNYATPDLLGGVTATSSGTIYYPDVFGNLLSVGPTGNVNWIVQGQYLHGKITVGPDGTVYIGGSNYFGAISPAGKVLWTDREAGHFDYAASVAADGTVYASCGQSLIAFDSSGSKLWATKAAGKALKGSAVNSAGDVVVCDAGGKVYSYSATGTLLWSESAYPMLNDVPLFGTDGRIYLGISTVSGIATFKELTAGGAFLMQSDAIDPVDAGGRESQTAIGANGEIYCTTNPTSSVELYHFSAAGKRLGKAPAGITINIAVAHGGLVFTGQYIYKPTLDLFAQPPFDGTVFLGKNGKVYNNASIHGGYTQQLNVYNANGSLGMAVQGRQVTSSPVVAKDGTVYIADILAQAGSQGGAFHAYEANGTQRWVFPLAAGTATKPETVAGAALVGPDGTVYFQSNYYAYALTSKGVVKWSAPYGGSSSPSLGLDGSIYFSAGHMVALKPDGTVNWKFGIQGRTFSTEVAIGKDGSVYLTDNLGHLMSVSIQGTLNWSALLTSDLIGNPVVGADGTIYVLAGAFIKAVTPAGTTLWSTTPKSGGAAFDLALAADGTIYSCGGDGISSISPAGVVNWNRSFPGPSIVRPVAPSLASDGTVYFGTTDGVFHALNAAGTELWSLMTTGIVEGSTFGAGYLAPSAAIGAGGVIYLPNQSLFVIK